MPRLGKEEVSSGDVHVKDNFLGEEETVCVKESMVQLENQKAKGKQT